MSVYAVQIRDKFGRVTLGYKELDRPIKAETLRKNIFSRQERYMDFYDAYMQGCYLFFFGKQSKIEDVLRSSNNVSVRNEDLVNAEKAEFIAQAIVEEIRTNGRAFIYFSKKDRLQINSFIHYTVGSLLGFVPYTEHTPKGIYLDSIDVYHPPFG